MLELLLWSSSTSSVTPRSSERQPLRLEEFPRLHIEGTRKALQYINRGSVDASLEGTDIRAVDVRTICEFFLRQRLAAPMRAEVLAKDVAN
jgi:hypothetical protein